MKKAFFISAVLLLFLVKFSYSQSYDFDLQDLEGNSVKLSTMLAKGPVLLQFWATWCVPCKEEMKGLNDLWIKHKDSGFGFIAISIDDQKTLTKVKPFIESKGYKFTVVYDTDKNVFKTFGGQDPPFSVLLSRTGDVIKTYSGFLPGDDQKLDDDITKALGDKGKN
jgi:cytochrome c biogenesis protein CcmG, thiol:disulfide interchange protein DsbE